MNRYQTELLDKISSNTARIGVIGLGYVGMPILIRFCEEGFKVIGFDVDKKKTDMLNNGRSYIRHIASEKIASMIKGKEPQFVATTDMSRLKSVDVIIICVPTPLSPKREPNMEYIVSTTNEITKYLTAGTLVSLESTTYPGTTEEILKPMFDSRGLKAGTDYFLVFSPEREDPGRKDFTTKNTPKIVGGITPNCSKVGTAIYSKILDIIVPVSSTKVSEMVKLLENIYRSVNIALVNELKLLCDRMDINIWEVIDAAKTKPFGFSAFYPGPGLGGHCIPIDPFYLTWKAREFDFATRFIELAGEINTSMPYFVIQKVMDALNENGQSLKGSKVLVLGMAYKKDIDDMRESPSIELIKLLGEKGAKVKYNDPFIPKAESPRKGFQMRSTPLNYNKLNQYDCVLIATAHTGYDYKQIVKNANLVVDTRNATEGIRSKKIVRA